MRKVSPLTICTKINRQDIEHVDADESKENNYLPLIEDCMTEETIEEGKSPLVSSSSLTENDFEIRQCNIPASNRRQLCSRWKFLFQKNEQSIYRWEKLDSEHTNKTHKTFCRKNIEIQPSQHKYIIRKRCNMSNGENLEITEMRKLNCSKANLDVIEHEENDEIALISPSPKQPRHMDLSSIDIKDGIDRESFFIDPVTLQYVPSRITRKILNDTLQFSEVVEETTKLKELLNSNAEQYAEYSIRLKIDTQGKTVKNQDVNFDTFLTEKTRKLFSNSSGRGSSRSKERKNNHINRGPTKFHSAFSFVAKPMLPSSKEIKATSTYHSQLNGVCNFENNKPVLQMQHENQHSGDIKRCKPHTNILRNDKTNFIYGCTSEELSRHPKNVHYDDECEIDYTYYREWMRKRNARTYVKSRHKMRERNYH
mmetsp:Transcript_56334/g.67853  ORF Transcript_56334/g.67853 Transcript_56334/m.67853 type:complete len:425 (+) Transcript_56334:32-1306(+)